MSHRWPECLPSILVPQWFKLVALCLHFWGGVPAARWNVVFDNIFIFQTGSKHVQPKPSPLPSFIILSKVCCHSHSECYIPITECDGFRASLSPRLSSVQLTKARSRPGRLPVIGSPSHLAFRLQSFPNCSRRVFVNYFTISFLLIPMLFYCTLFARHVIQWIFFFNLSFWNTCLSVVYIVNRIMRKDELCQLYERLLPEAMSRSEWSMYAF